MDVDAQGGSMLRWSVLVGLVGCAGARPLASDDDGRTPFAPPLSTFSLSNTGSPALEGHTPRGFEGEGTGLFTGDDINPGFPDFEGTQLFVAFDLRQAEEGDLTELGWGVLSAELSSQAAEIRGTPFEDLGVLEVDEVVYGEFSSALWDLEPVDGGHTCVLADDADGPFGCDIGPAVQAALDDGRPLVQLRVRMSVPGDGDGEPDMVLFHAGDTNATTAGLFELSITTEPRQP
jgi:hypothetical protein